MFWVLVVMAANAAYVAALPSATIFYVANVLLHLVLGAAGVGWLLWKWRRSARALPLAAAALAGALSRSSPAPRSITAPCCGRTFCWPPPGSPS